MEYVQINRDRAPDCDSYARPCLVTWCPVWGRARAPYVVLASHVCLAPQISHIFMDRVMAAQGRSGC